MKLLSKTLLLSASLVMSASAQEIKREITRVTDDIYRFQNQFHVNMIVVSGDGVVVTDPINAEAAAWLKTQINEITDQPITTLVYSHSHGDHASGGDEYGDISTVISHKNAPEYIGLVEPTIRFSDEMSFVQGDKTFELTYLGPGHGTDLIAMVVRPDNVAFVVDAISARRLFYRDFPGTNVDHWIEQVRRVNSLDFDILIGGHGPVGEKADVANGLAYLEKLRAAVLEGLNAGKSVDQLKQEIKMEKYSTWEAYDNWLELNIEGMARHLMETDS